MTKQHTIEIEGLPEGWKAVLVEMESDASSYMIGEHMHLMAKVVLEKIQPRRIVLEETGEVRPAQQGEFYFDGYRIIQTCGGTSGDVQIWRVVNEE